MTNLKDELSSAVTASSPKRIAKACVHVDSETILKILRFAVFQHRSSAVIEELLKHAGQSNLSSVLLVAVNRQNFEAFDVVWNYVDPYEDQKEVLKAAVVQGSTVCVRKLMQRQDFSAYFGYFGGNLLAQACFNQDADMVDLLYGVCDPQMALDNLKRQNCPTKYTQLIVQRMEQEQLHAHLSEVTLVDATPERARKI